MSKKARFLNTNITKAKKASLDGPVFITNRSYTFHASLSTKEHQKIMPGEDSILGWLSIPKTVDVEFEPGEFADEEIKPANFS